MKYLVSLAALIALLGCGSDSDILTPDPSMDMGQPAERNESPIVEDPLVEPPEVFEPPPKPPMPPEVIAEMLKKNAPMPPEVIAEIMNQEPPVPPEVIEMLKKNAPIPPEVIAEIMKNQDPPEFLPGVAEILKPKVMAEPTNGDPPPDE